MDIKQTQLFDITVVGGGMVGAASAVLLAKKGWRVALIETTGLQPIASDEPMDIRVSAISPASVKLLQQAGAWPAIFASDRIKPYQELMTWEMAGTETSFLAKDVGRQELGYILENRLIQQELWQQAKLLSNLVLFCPAKVSALNMLPHGCDLTLDDGSVLQSGWVLAADGANSQLRTLAGIGISRWDYRQDCMLIHVGLKEEAPAITWQRFYPSGPRSFLPLAQKQASLVWYDQPEKIKALQALQPEALTRAVRVAFPPERLPEFDVLRAASFPLIRRHASHYVEQRVILLGDAAHTIHPLAGQGVNIGFQDVELLCRLANDSHFHDEVWNAISLRRYERERSLQNQVMQRTMDGFYGVFSNNCTPLKWARNAGLMMVNHVPGLKKAALYHALGILPFSR